MSDLQIFFIVVAGVIALAGFFGLILSRTATGGADEAWRKFAERHRLEFDPKGGKGRAPLVRGEVDGYAFSMQMESSGQNRAAFTSIEVELNRALPPGLFFGPEKIRREVLKKIVVGQDVTIGDSHFDERVVVKVEEPRHLGRYLSAARKDAVLRLVDIDGQLKDGKLQVKKRGRLENLEELDEIYRRLKGVASVLDVAG